MAETVTLDQVTAQFESALDRKFGSLTKMPDTLDGIVAKLNEPKPETKVEAKPEPVAGMEEKAGILGGITKMEVWDIPVGQAVVGGFVAVFGSELIDGFFAKQSNTTKAVIKLAAAGAAVKFGGKLFGSTGSKAVALLLAYDGLRSLLPIDEWAGKATSMVTRRTGAGLAGRAGMGAVGQAERYLGIRTGVGDTISRSNPGM